MRSKYSYLSNGNNPLAPHVINTPAVTPNINGRILPPQINNISQISPNVCNGVNALNPSCGNSCPLPGNNPYIVDNSPHAANNIYQGQKSSMRDHHISLQQQQQKRFYEVPVCSEYMGSTSTNNYSPNDNNPLINPLVPQMINVPAVTPNIYGQILPPQIGYLDIPQISPNVCNSMNAFNSYCGSSCPLPGTNPFTVNNSPHAVNDIYQGQKSSMMRDYHISLQQQQQKRSYEVPVISEYMGFTPTNNYSPNDNNPLVPHVINAPAVTPNNLSIPQISSNVCSSFSPLPDNDSQNFSIMDSSSHAVNDNYQDQESSTMHDCRISLQQQQQKRDYEVPGFSEYMVSIATNSYPPNGNNPLVPNVISTPAVTHNINGQILSPQMNHHNTPQISPNVCNGVNTFNPSCGNSCPLSCNNPSIAYNSPHVANDNYQGQECPTMCDYHISHQKQVYELPEFPGNVGFTLTNNHQFAQSMNIPQIEPGGQILASQSEISQGSLSNYGSTVQSYVPDNNCVRQSSETTSLQNYQNYYYSPSQQQ
ncbi:unnamed protein product [Rhizophagus irregularis]|nr:unnamed protein product [Rhizophagus irregularis]